MRAVTRSINGECLSRYIQESDVRDASYVPSSYHGFATEFRESFIPVDRESVDAVDARNEGKSSPVSHRYIAVAVAPIAPFTPGGRTFLDVPLTHAVLRARAFPSRFPPIATPRHLNACARARPRVAFHDGPPRRFKSAHFNGIRERGVQSGMKGSTRSACRHRGCLTLPSSPPPPPPSSSSPPPFSVRLPSLSAASRSRDQTSTRTHEKRSLARRVHQSLREAGDDSVPAAAAPNAGERESEAPLGESESSMVGVTARAPIDARRCRVPPRAHRGRDVVPSPSRSRSSPLTFRPSPLLRPFPFSLGLSLSFSFSSRRDVSLSVARERRPPRRVPRSYRLARFLAASRSLSPLVVYHTYTTYTRLAPFYFSNPAGRSASRTQPREYNLVLRTSRGMCVYVCVSARVCVHARIRFHVTKRSR